MRLLARIAAVFVILFGLGILAVMVYLGMHQDSVVFTTPRNWGAVFGGIVFGLVFCVGGLYIWRVDSDGSEKQQTSTQNTSPKTVPAMQG